MLKTKLKETAITLSFLAVALISLNSAPARALDFELFTATFIMGGEFEQGDTERFINELSKLEHPPEMFFLSDSSGGDLDEAMRIGLMLRASNITVWAGNGCYSACVFALMSGVERGTMEGDMGLHRPSFNAEYFSSLSPSEAELEYKRLTAASTKFLTQMDAPQELIRRMFETDSGNIYILSDEEKETLIPPTAPYYEEWVAAKCGSVSNERKETLASIGSLRALVAEIQLVEDGTLQRSAERSIQWEKWKEESAAAFELLDSGVDLNEYTASDTLRYECADNAVKESKQVFMAVVKEVAEGKIENPWGRSLLYGN